MLSPEERIAIVYPAPLRKLIYQQVHEDNTRIKISFSTENRSYVLGQAIKIIKHSLPRSTVLSFKLMYSLNVAVMFFNDNS